jgi:hypothetical protein
MSEEHDDEHVEEVKPITQTEKQLLKETVKEWIKIDNELKELAKFMRDKRLRKKEINDSLMKQMKQKNIHGFDTHTDGTIMYVENKVKVPLNKKHLMEALSNIFEGSTEKAEQVSNYILDTREEKTREQIRRKAPKISDTESVTSKSTITWSGFISSPHQK